MMPTEKARERKNRIGTIGAGTQFPDNEGHRKPGPCCQRRDDLKTAPAGAIAAYQPPHYPQGRTRHQYKAAHVKIHACPETLWDATEHERNDEQADGDVEPEDPLPGEALGDRATYYRASEKGQPGHTPEDPQRPPSSLRRERRAQLRQRQRHDQRCPASLDSARGDQPADVGR